MAVLGHSRAQSVCLASQLASHRSKPAAGGAPSFTAVAYRSSVAGGFRPQLASKRSLLCQAASDEIDKALSGKGPEAEAQQAAEPEEPRDDDVLPDSLSDALVAASKSTAAAIARGNQRCVVEVLLPEFWDPISGPFFSAEGDQLRWWKLSRRFVEELADQAEFKQVRAIYPDMGVVAMLQNQWPDINFKMSSLNDRRPIDAEDDLIVLATPDPQGLEDCYRVVNMLGETGPPIVMFNPRLVSGDVGIGLNMRRLQSKFLKTFQTTYSLRPIQDIGTVFRSYPGLWKVFIQDEAAPGRYKLIAERPSRPAGEALDNIIMDAIAPESEDGQKAPPGVMQQVVGTMASMQRFMRSLSN